ncbi:MAG: N-acetyltransferase [Candidatus Aenigmarchaeota archaeon]|nr:N-acetyltransferase [Candidatus Aenigmarchaeota archaeon]
MHLNIEHDDMGQKFWTEAEGEECLLAYTMINDCLNLHFLTAPNGQVADELCTAAFEHARKNGLKITSSNEYVDEFVRKHPEFRDLLETE